MRRTLAPGSAVLADHPRTVNVREDVITAWINEWIGSADAEACLRRFQAVTSAGVDPAAVVEPINHAHDERDAARAHLVQVGRGPRRYSEAEVNRNRSRLPRGGAAAR
jgi:hypothetical protein